MNRTGIEKYQNIINGCIIALMVTTMATVFFRDRITYMLIQETQIGMVDVTRQDCRFMEGRIENTLDGLSMLSKIVSIDGINSLDRNKPFIESSMKDMGFSAYGVLTVGGKGLIGPDYSLREFNPIKVAARGNRTCSYLYKIPQLGGPGVMYAVPIVRDKKVTGVLYGFYSMEDVKPLSITTFGEGGFFCVMDDKGRFLLNTDDKELASMLESRFFCWQDQPNDKELFSLFNKVSQYGEGIEKITLKDQSEYFVVCIPLNTDIGVYLMDIVPLSLVHGRIQRVLNVVTVVMLLLLCCLLIMYSYSQYHMIKNQEKLFSLAYVDNLTGVGNLASYKKDFARLKRANPEQTMCVVSIDVNNMKEINEIMGFHFGNKLLTNVGKFAKDSLRDNEGIYRIANDVFYMIMFCKSRSEVTERIRSMFENISSYYNSQHGMFLTMASGVCLLERNITEADEILLQEESQHTSQLEEQVVLVVFDALDSGDNATLARRQGKFSNKNSVAFYDEGVKKRKLLEKELEDAFEPAMENGEFILYYQPKYDVRGEMPVLCGAEALVRWISPTNGFMPPGVFIPLFERDGNCERLDMHVVELVCRQIHEWLESGYRVVPVSINISRQTIMQGQKFVDNMEALLDKHGISKDYIQLEVLESGNAEDEGMLINFLDTIRKHGFKLAMDDFGTGYSSLGLLSRTKLDCLKLDKSFFDGWDAKTIESRKILVENIFKLCHSVGAEIVAEGIESEQQVEILRNIGCDVIQGYVFSKPLPVDEYQKKMENRNV